MMEIVQVIVDHAFVQNTYRHCNMSKKILSQHIDIRIDLGQQHKKTKEFTYIRNGFTIDQHMKCTKFYSFSVNHRSLHFLAARPSWLYMDKVVN